MHFGLLRIGFKSTRREVYRLQESIFGHAHGPGFLKLSSGAWELLDAKERLMDRNE